MRMPTSSDTWPSSDVSAADPLVRQLLSAAVAAAAPRDAALSLGEIDALLGFTDGEAMFDAHLAA